MYYSLRIYSRSSPELELLLKAVSPDKRRRTVHLIEIADLLRDLDIPVVVIQLLLHQFLTEHNAQFFRRHRL